MVCMQGKGNIWERLYRFSAWAVFALALGGGGALGAWLAFGAGPSLGRLAVGLGTACLGVVIGLRALSSAMLRLGEGPHPGP